MREYQQIHFEQHSFSLYSMMYVSNHIGKKNCECMTYGINKGNMVGVLMSNLASNSAVI